MGESSLVRLVAVHPTAGTSKPTIPNKGANVASWTGWTVFGSKDFDSADVDLENVVLPYLMTEKTAIKPPRSEAPKGHVLQSQLWSPFEFTAAENSEAALAIASAASITSNVLTGAGALTKRAVCIEIEGLGLYYFPQCVVEIDEAPGDYKEDYEQTKFIVTPEDDGTLTAGGSKDWYQAA